MRNKRLQKPIFTGMLVAIGVVLSEFLAISLPPTENPVIRFSIGYLPIILAGVFYGPVYGGVAGIVQDLVGFFLFGIAHGYAFHPGYTLNAALYGVLPAILIRTAIQGERRLFHVLNYVAAAVLLGLSTWYFFDIEAVYSRTLDNSSKLLLSGFALFAALGIAALNFLMRKADGRFQPSKLIFAVVAMYALTSLFLTPLWLWTVNPGYSIWLNLPLRLLKMPIEATFYVLILLPALNVFDKLDRPSDTSIE
ncbi:MAG: folate family ECF transporter S component [Candidatus Izemoplasmatales bacterium]